jgi:hypothetical protein
LTGCMTLRRGWQISRRRLQRLAGDPVPAQEPARDRQAARHSTRSPQQGDSTQNEPRSVQPLTVYNIYIVSTPEKVVGSADLGRVQQEYFSGFAVEMERRLAAVSSCARPTVPSTSPVKSSNTIRRTS